MSAGGADPLGVVSGSSPGPGLDASALGGIDLSQYASLFSGSAPNLPTGFSF
jgi:hypothetical protein